MKIEIRNRLTSKVIFECEADSMKTAVEMARKQGVSLSDADLCGMDLSYAYLCGMDLRGANLSAAYLRGADLRGMNLTGADLSGANLSAANLLGADLSGANLLGSDLRGANLTDTNLTDVKNFSFQIIPEEGAFIGWKKLKNGVIAKLEIPADAKRTSTPISRKNRAEFVRVMELFGAEEGISQYDGKTIYRVGEIVRPDSYNGDIRLECTNGIHFFITRNEAEAY